MGIITLMRTIYRSLLIFFLTVLTIGGLIFAGSITPLSSPEPTFYTIEDIYQFVENGTIPPGHSLAPTEPTDSSMHSVSDLYQLLANLIQAEDLASTSVTYLGVSGAEDTPAVISTENKEFSPTTEAGTRSGYTLNDIYNLIVDNNRIEIPSGEYPPETEPADSMHTLEEIYDLLVNLIQPEDINIGSTYLGVQGAYVPEFCGGDGTEGDPYQICYWTQFNNVRDYLDASYILMNDLTAEDVDYDGLGNDWSPIGDGGNPFSGTFDGNNKIIYYLVINSPETNDIGLFATLTGTISYLGLSDVNITGASNVGSLVGTIHSGATVDHSYSSGEVVGSGEYIGGLIGFADGNSTIISYSYTSGTVTGGSWYAHGGLLGALDGNAEVTNSYSTADVTSESGSWDTGGLIGGSTDGIINYSYATGSVVGDEYVGGLLGGGYSLAAINTSYATGDVSGSDSVGGLAGIIGPIFDSFSVGNVSCSSNCGGLVGQSGGVDNSIYDTDTSGQSDNTKGYPKTTVQMKTLTTWNWVGLGWDIATSSTDLNDGYPYFGWQDNDNSYTWFIYE